MDEEIEITVRELLRTDFLSLEADLTVSEALKEFSEYETDNSKPSLYYIYVLDSESLEGVISVKDLLEADSNAVLKDIITRDFISVSLDQDLEEAARKMSEYDYQAFPVLKDNEMKGIIRLDDMLDVLENAASEDIFKKAGFSIGLSSKEASRSNAVLNSSITDIIKIRLPWLMVALLGGIIAGEVIHGFEEELQVLIALAFFIPVIMDMGGNVGTQASTIFVRGVALGDINRSNVFSRVLKEGIVGLSIGGIVGSLAALFAWFRYSEPIVSVVLVISMSLTCFIASLIGFLIPWTAEKTGYDPAAVSDPLITTVKDITALLIYFGSASILLGL